MNKRNMSVIFRSLCSTKNPTITMMTFGFWCGVGAHAGFGILLQDAMGLEGYIAHVREHWVNLHPIVGATLCASFLWAFFLIRSEASKALEGKQ
jgi:hypothetical protein